MRMLRTAVALLLVLVSAPACKQWDSLRELLGFEVAKKRSVQPEIQTEVKSAEGEAEQTRRAGELARENKELLGEVVRVVFNQDTPDDQTDFEGLAQSLNQGASLEGVYRGLVMGSRYRGLESKAQGASPGEIRIFAAEMAEIQSIMMHPTRFDAESKKVPTIDYPDESSANTPASPSRVEDEGDVKKGKADVEQELIRTFIGASLYTLKRVLGEEVLRRFDEAKDDPESLAQWYAGTVVRLIQKGVDGGLELRNKPDYQFHLAFARKMSQDRVKWEVLNRYHRYLNAAARKAR